MEIAAQSPAEHLKGAPRPSRSRTNRSKVTNGRELLPGIDGRSPTARRYRDITTAILVDQGGEDRCSESRKHLIRRFAAAAVLAERLEAKLVSGAEIDIQEHATLCSSLVRLGARIGIDRLPRDISPSLSDYLAADSTEADGVSDTDVADERPTGHGKAAEAASKPTPTMALDSALSESDAELSDLDEDVRRICKGEVI